LKAKRRRGEGEERGGKRAGERHVRRLGCWNACVEGIIPQDWGEGKGVTWETDGRSGCKEGKGKF